MAANWVSMIPFLIVIPVAIWTKQVLPGLTLGLLVGSYLMEPSVLGGLQKMLAYVVQSLTGESKIKILIFLYVFSGLIGIIKMSGGIKGFVEFVSQRITTKTGALLITWISTLGTFSAPAFRIITIAPVMKALLQRISMSKQELGFVIQTTSSPVIVLVPVATAFVGYMTSVIQISLKNQGIKQDAYALFIQSIPFNFFSISIILLGIYLGFFRRSKDKQLPEIKDNQKHEKDDWHNCHPAVGKELPSKPLNLAIPLILILGLTLLITWWDGRAKATNFLQAFIKADVMGSMVIALIITFFVTMIMLLFQKIPLRKIISHFMTGGNDLMPVIILLAVVWALAVVTEDLGFSKFVTSNMGWIPTYFIPPILFLVGSLISYFIGSSWGTWGMLMPLGVSLAQVSGTSLPLVIGAVFASGTFGAFASPLSDTTVTLSKILDLPVIAYSRYKLIPALIAAGIATFLYGAVTFIL